MTTLGIKGGQPNWDKIIKVVVIIALIVAAMIGLHGCRTVHKTQEIVKKNIDSTTEIRHDSSTIENYTNWDDYFSTDSIAVHIEFKDSSKPVMKPEHPHSFLDNLMQLANSGNLKVLDIRAKKVKDSSNILIRSNSTTLNNDTITHVIDKTKTKVSAKDIKSNTNLLAIGGGLILLLTLFFIVWKWVTKKEDTATSIVEKVANKI